ncbi:MAG TPA: double-strand break repair helicase AddA [Stellaceae bacterium]|nr:double-strand break repair helicase AddA [Stellaceae bacterium]
MVSPEERDSPQRRAIDPEASVWVAASAGTGKTKVLTDRLLALMLGGTDPTRTLCLTFTRAAAAEMANRLNERLAIWATLPDGALAGELVELTGHDPDEIYLARARQLFARVLDAPGGIKIATIHAFCQSLLRRFPLEAGVSPEFAVLDERSAQEALAEAGETVIAAARDSADRGLAEALASLTRYMTEERFQQLLTALVGERGKLRAALEGGLGPLRAKIWRHLSLPGEASPQSLLEAFCAGGALAALAAAARALAEGGKSDRGHAAILAPWCASAADRPALLSDYVQIFLTEGGEIRHRLANKSAACLPVLQIEAQRVKEFATARAAVAIGEASLALARLGAAVLRAYDRHKRATGLLDYDDLIETTRNLLRRPEVAPWVLFKLDGGLDHILIDEAQDTNPEQWEIVAALAQEFFAGEGARESLRTIFAVGDAKQSIYSFQRADPRAFLTMRRHFEARVDAARQKWRIVPLDVSYRSTEPVLRAVDAIFRGEAARDGVALEGGDIRHRAHRQGQAGVVELWPPVAPEPETPDPDALPVARRRTAEPYARLAAAIAATIGGWLAGGERLEARGRAIRAGDIMVLVRRRTLFLGELVRQLKARDIPVAGADRLLLGKELAVQDLAALGRFLLLPEDDLTLAAVLKGPLFGIDEGRLFDLAYGRAAKTLWQRLREAARRDDLLRQSAERLAGLLARADFTPPYELYAEILGAEGGRRVILERLGPEAADPIEEFLALALAYEREHVPSLQGFLHWLAAGDSEVKRDFGARPRDEVRMLTVHGAKGLEAPIIFLPDTMQVPNPPSSLLWSEKDRLPLWRPRADVAVPPYAAEREAMRRRQLEEYRRLLYVGLTRAQDRLYICGWQTRRPPTELCWHTLCRDGLAAIAEPFPFDATASIGRDGWTGEGLRLAAAQTADPERSKQAAPALGADPLPDWLDRPAPPEPDPPKPLVPSRPAEPEPAPLSPLARDGRDRFKRGLIIHRLLQSLPDLPEAERESAARRFLAAPTHGLDAAAQDEIRREALAVLRHPDFAPLFAPGSLAEVPLTGLIDGHAVAGQIDRLVVDATRVLIVDFKTLRPAPASEAEVAPSYLRQLAIYRAALARIFPGREIRCALLWTDGPLLMPVSPERLEGWLA